jgi:hypothetical protein
MKMNTHGLDVVSTGRDKAMYHGLITPSQILCAHVHAMIDGMNTSQKNAGARSKFCFFFLKPYCHTKISSYRLPRYVAVALCVVHHTSWDMRKIIHLSVIVSLEFSRGLDAHEEEQSHVFGGFDFTFL